MDSPLISKPLFSIVMPVYEVSSSHLSRAINSVLSQQCHDWELIIVEDGISSTLTGILTEYPQTNIIHYKIVHAGVSRARNYAIEKSNGLFICFLDADDEYFPNHLSLLQDYVKKNLFPISVLRTGMVHYFKEKSIPTGLYNSNEWLSPAHFILSNFYGINSLCIHRSICLQIPFNQTLKYLEDTEFLLRSILSYPFHQIPHYTSAAYAHEQQSSNKLYFSNSVAEDIDVMIKSIDQIFIRFGRALSEQLPAGFKQQWIADKYVQYANGLLLARKFRLSLNFLGKSLILNRSLKNAPYYLKFFLKFPIKVFFKR